MPTDGDETAPRDEPPAEEQSDEHVKAFYKQAFFLSLAAKGKEAWNAWRRDPVNQHESVDFAGVDFSKAPLDTIDFAGFEFGHWVDFSHCVWRGVPWQFGGDWQAGYGFGIRFDPKAFTAGRANFIGAKFGPSAFFIDAAFGDEAFFDQSSFDAHPSFAYATFGDGASFTGADFGSWTSFHYTTFGDGANFNGTTFEVLLPLMARPSAVAPASTAPFSKIASCSSGIPNQMRTQMCGYNGIGGYGNIVELGRIVFKVFHLRARVSKVAPISQAALSKV